jgi:hypothetical protein
MLDEDSLDGSRALLTMWLFGQAVSLFLLWCRKRCPRIKN